MKRHGHERTPASLHCHEGTPASLHCHEGTRRRRAARPGRRADQTFASSSTDFARTRIIRAPSTKKKKIRTSLARASPGQSQKAHGHARIARDLRAVCDSHMSVFFFYSCRVQNVRQNLLPRATAYRPPTPLPRVPGRAARRFCAGRPGPLERPARRGEGKRMRFGGRGGGVCGGWNRGRPRRAGPGGRGEGIVEGGGCSEPGSRGRGARIRTRMTAGTNKARATTHTMRGRCPSLPPSPPSLPPSLTHSRALPPFLPPSLHPLPPSVPPLRPSLRPSLLVPPFVPPSLLPSLPPPLPSPSLSFAVSARCWLSRSRAVIPSHLQPARVPREDSEGALGAPCPRHASACPSDPPPPRPAAPAGGGQAGCPVMGDRALRRSASPPSAVPQCGQGLGTGLMTALPMS